MRVVHLTSVHTPVDTRVAFKECLSLAEAGHDVHLVALASALGDVPASALPTAPTLEVHLLGDGQLVGRAARATLGARAVTRFARSLGADLYHLHDPELLLWAWTLGRTGAPVVFDMHENLPLAVRDKAWIPRPARRPAAAAVRVAERALLRGRPVVFAEDSYKDHYPNLPRTVDVRNYPVLPALPDRARRRGGPFTLGYVGGVSEARGLFAVLEALRLLRERGADVGFECVGPVSDADRSRAERFCRDHGLDGVRLHGRLPAPEAWAQVARVDAGVVVIERIGNYVRSLPTKLLEYMGMGLPVIASDFPLYRRVVADAACGLTVAPERPAELADAVLRLMADPEGARAMGESGRRAARERYSWAPEAERLLAFYERLVGPAPPPTGAASAGAAPLLTPLHAA